MSDIDRLFDNLRRSPFSGQDPNSVLADQFLGPSSIHPVGFLDDDSVTSDAIRTDAVIARHVEADAITAGKIDADAVTAREIAANTVTANEIAANTITASEIAANTITANEIAANTITANEIAANTITATEIAADSITTSELAADAVITENILAANVTSSRIELTISGKNFGSNAGTAGSPGVYFDADSDTGLYSSGTNQISVSAGGTDALSANATFLVVNRSTQPALNNTYALGSSLLAWSDIFCQNPLTVTSDRNAKTDIEDSPLGLEFIRALRPRSFRWRDTVDTQARVDVDYDGLNAATAPYRDFIRHVRDWPEGPDFSAEVELAREQIMSIRDEFVAEAKAGQTARRPGRRQHFGLVAQEVKQALQETGIDAAFWRRDATTGRQALIYDELLAPLIAAVQELDRDVQEIQKSLNQHNDK